MKHSSLLTDVVGCKRCTAETLATSNTPGEQLDVPVLHMMSYKLAGGLRCSPAARASQGCPCCLPTVLQMAQDATPVP